MESRTGVLALDPAKARVDGAGGGTGSVLVHVDPVATLAAIEGREEEAGELQVSRACPPVPKEDGDPTTIGVVDTARREDTQ